MATAEELKDQSPPSLVDAMMRSDFYGPGSSPIELRQTHISYVFLTEEFAYKIKKPLRLPWLDSSTLGKRHELCKCEIILNRRLAPDVYLAVVPITFRDGTFRFGQAPKDEQAAIEFAVKMRRLPDDQRLDNRIAARKISAAEIQGVANRLAEFHATASRQEAWRYGTAAAIWRLVVGNIAETERLLADTVSRDKLRLIEAYARSYISARWQFLNTRALNGYVLDGHGDLRTDSVYLTDGGIRIIDCVEFSAALRYGDTASEVAFLAMDLDRLKAPELATELVRSYVLATGDGALPVLLPFYQCYRALVRAKVELIASNQLDRPVAERIACREMARCYLDQACAYIA